MIRLWHGSEPGGFKDNISRKGAKTQGKKLQSELGELGAFAGKNLS
jgi:hypothetical protein